MGAHCAQLKGIHCARLVDNLEIHALLVDNLEIHALLVDNLEIHALLVDNLEIHALLVNSSQLLGPTFAEAQFFGRLGRCRRFSWFALE